jgi:hypothetical protein
MTVTCLDACRYAAYLSFARISLPCLVSFLLSLWVPVASLPWNSIECRAIGDLVLVSCGGVRLSPLGTSATNWPIVPAPDDIWWWMWNGRWNENWQGKPKYSEKTYPSATLSTTNPTWPDPRSNTGRLGGKPATNHLSYGTTCHWRSQRSNNFLCHQYHHGCPANVWRMNSAVSSALLWCVVRWWAFGCSFIKLIFSKNEGNVVTMGIV